MQRLLKNKQPPTSSGKSRTLVPLCSHNCWKRPSGGADSDGMVWENADPCVCVCQRWWTSTGNKVSYLLPKISHLFGRWLREKKVLMHETHAAHQEEPKSAFMAKNRLWRSKMADSKWTNRSAPLTRVERDCQFLQKWEEKKTETPEGEGLNKTQSYFHASSASDRWKMSTVLFVFGSFCTIHLLH